MLFRSGGGYEFNNGTRTLAGLTTRYAFIGGGYDSASYINDFYLGAAPFVTRGELANLNIYSPSATTDPTSGAPWNGIDAPGSNFTVNAGRGTGTGTPGDFIIKTATKTTTGNTLQTLTERLKVAGDSGDITAASLAGGSTRMVVADSAGKLSTQIIPSGGGVRSINSVNTNTTAGSTSGTDYVYLVSGTTTITLPSPTGNTSSYTIKRVGTNAVSIATTSGTIDGSTSPITINVQYVSVTVVSDGTNWFII